MNAIEKLRNALAVKSAQRGVVLEINAGQVKVSCADGTIRGFNAIGGLQTGDSVLILNGSLLKVGGGAVETFEV